MKGKLEFKEELQGQPVIAVTYNGLNAGVLVPSGDGYWYRWGQISDYSTELSGAKVFVIELFNQLDSFINKL